MAGSSPPPTLSNRSSKPIQIPPHGPYNRHRSHSTTSSSSSTDEGSEGYSPPLQTPNSSSTFNPPPDVVTSSYPSTSPLASTSPLLSYFLANPGGKLANPFGRPTFTPSNTNNNNNNNNSAVANDDEVVNELPVSQHARRVSMSTGWPQGPGSLGATTRATTDSQKERGAGVLRRLSLGGAFNRPTINTQVPSVGGGLNNSGSDSPPMPKAPPSSPDVPRKPRRSATLSVTEHSKRRAPSPMGERILKGHFDGFN